MDWNAFIRVYLQVPEKSLNTFIDKIGREVIPTRYFDAKSFSGGVALVRPTKLDRWFEINKKGECAEFCDEAPAGHPITK